MGSSITEKNVTINVRRKAFFSRKNSFFRRSISISPNAIFIRIAAIIGKGRYWKKLLKRRNEIPRVKIDARNAEDLWVAPLFIFSAVRINTAVAGSPPNSHDPILAIPSQRTSRSLSKCFFVIFSAIFAEIIVSSIAIIAITREARNIDFIRSIASERLSIQSQEYGFCQREKARVGNFSESKSRSGKTPRLLYIPRIIPRSVRTMTLGNFGKYFFPIVRNPNPQRNTSVANIFT